MTHTNYKQMIESELAVFWDEIAENLPKSIERSALGDEKIFLAFKVAYPKIKSSLAIKSIDEEIKWLESKKKKCDCICGAMAIYDEQRRSGACWGQCVGSYNLSIDHLISHLLEDKQKIQNEK